MFLLFYLIDLPFQYSFQLHQLPHVFGKSRVNGAASVELVRHILKEQVLDVEIRLVSVLEADVHPFGYRAVVLLPYDTLLVLEHIGLGHLYLDIPVPAYPLIPDRLRIGRSVAFLESGGTNLFLLFHIKIFIPLLPLVGRCMAILEHPFT